MKAAGAESATEVTVPPPPPPPPEIVTFVTLWMIPKVSTVICAT